jgi:hyaluronan synthase
MLEGQSEFYLFAIFSTTIWVLWLLKVLLSRRYKPYTGEYHGTTSVVIPVVDEPLDLFRDVLTRIVEQRPDEVIVVINGAVNPALQAVSEEFAPLVRWVHTPIPGKRNAVKIGTELSRGEITVLVDSDTVWTDGTLSELVKPFADASVGGATTRQRILEPERSWITRWADWLENTRALYSMPAQSALGQVGCLPGRTIAFRRHILVQVMDDFMHQKFMGVFLEVSDDRTLTNLTLKAGYKSVYQYTSLVYTDAPLQVKKLAKQQLRWARGSQYNTLRMLPWMIGHAPLLAVFFIADILLPFLLFGTIAGWIYRSASGTGTNLYQAILQTYTGMTGWLWVIATMIVSSVLSMAIRQIRHLHEKPSDFLRLPVFIIVSTLFLMPIRLLGFLRMAHASGWGTRAGAYAGGAPGGDDLIAELEKAPAAPADLVDRAPAVPTQRLASPNRTVLSDPAAVTAPLAAPVVAPVATATPAPARARRAATAAPATPARRRRLNPLAAIPYVIALALFALEALVYV